MNRNRQLGRFAHLGLKVYLFIYFSMRCTTWLVPLLFSPDKQVQVSMLMCLLEATTSDKSYYHGILRGHRKRKIHQLQCSPSYFLCCEFSSSVAINIACVAVFSVKRRIFLAVYSSVLGEKKPEDIIHYTQSMQWNTLARSDRTNLNEIERIQNKVNWILSNKIPI